MRCVTQLIVYTFVLMKVICSTNVTESWIKMGKISVTTHRQDSATQESYEKTSSRAITDPDVDNVAHYTETSNESTELSPESAEFLYQLLFRNYNRNVRPVQHRGLPVTVSVKLSLVAVDELDLRTKKELGRVVLELTWTDTHLAWDRRRYSNTTRFAVAAEKIWLPDLTIESLNGCFEFIKTSEIGRAVVDYRGTVTVWPSIHTELGIDIDVSRYPFDTQNISFIVGSWSYPTTEVEFKLVKEYDNLQSYQTNVAWEMLSDSSIEAQYEYANETYDRVGYQFTIRRRWLYFLMNVIGPVVLACILNLLVFLLPAESGQRVTLAISIFLCLTIFLSQTSTTLPNTSDGLSILVVYLCLQMVGSVMTIATSVFIIYISKKALEIEEQSSSNILSFLCQPVVSKQKLNENMKGNDESVASDSSVSKETATTKTKQEPNNAETSLMDEVDAVPRSKPRVRGSVFASWRKSQELRRNILLMTSAHINTVCMWLSVVWNIVLLVVLVIVGLVA